MIQRAHFVLSVLILGDSLLIAAQPQPVCEASPETRRAFKRLDENPLTGKERNEQDRVILGELLAKHPDDLFLLVRYQQVERRLAGVKTADAWKPVIGHYKDVFEKHPDDKKYAYLYARALVDTDTPQAIETLKKITSSEPPFPMAHVELAILYHRGSFADSSAARRQLEMYHRLCPASLDDDALALLRGLSTPATAAQYAAPLRARLTKETDPDLLDAWQTLWSLEFKARPPSEHAQVRRQISADLERLGRLPENTETLSLLIEGYKLVGDKQQVRHIEDRILSQYSDSENAAWIRNTRWWQQHPAPGPGDPEEKKQAFYRAELQWANEHLQKSGDFQALVMRFNALVELAASAPGEVAGAGAQMHEALHTGFRYAIPPYEFQIARGYLKHKTNLDLVPQLVDEGRESYGEGVGAFVWFSDRETADGRANRAEQKLVMRTEAAESLLDAAEQLQRAEIAKSAVEELADAKSANSSTQARLWIVRARWAELNGRKLDALLMYRAASKEKDSAAANFDRLWNELGGSAAGKGLLANIGSLSEAREGRWEKRAKALHPFELPDLNGKTWKLVSFAGKRLLINVWATWCGPCRLEHPYLEKLYENYKNRPDFEIITFNVDDDIGAVAPYMNDNQYTFPVLLARNYVDDLLSSTSIPRNWIVDGEGKWEWEQVGFYNDENWDKIILEKLGQNESR